MSDNWIVGNLQNALETWNEKLEEIWTLVTATPQDFKGGLVWDVIVGINGSLKAVGYALDIMTTLFAICGSIVQTMMDRIGAMSAASVTMPQEIIDAIEDVGFLASIPLWLVSLLGSLFITVMSFILILTVYGRFFKLYLYTAISPLPLASFAGEGTGSMGKAFIKSYTGVCLEGAVIVLACLIYSAFLSGSAPAADGSLPPVTMAWEYIGQLIFNMLILTGLVKGSDRVVREMFSL